MKFSAACAILLMAASASADSSGWPEFRGPQRDGLVDASLPIRWSEQTGITWKQAIPGAGWSTPLIQDGKIWLTTASLDGRTMSALCLEEKTGKILWEKTLITNDNPEPLANKVNSYASSTGAIESGRVYLHFGSYGTFCLDTTSYETIWQRRDISLSHWRGPASSMVLAGDRLVLTMEGADQQYFVALSTIDGKTLWRRDRSTVYNDEKDGIPANSGDMRKAFSTPLLVPVGDRIQMIINGSKACWSYDLATGAEIWQVIYETHSPSSRSVYDPETKQVFINTGLGKAEIWAVRLDETTLGNVTDTHVNWKFFKRAAKRSSPVLVKGHLFMANDGVVSCLDVKTGEDRWAERAGGEYSASLIANQDYIYCCDEDGGTFVIKALPTFELVSENRLDAGMMASPAVSGSALFLRTKTHLYRVDPE